MWKRETCCQIFLGDFLLILKFRRELLTNNTLHSSQKSFSSLHFIPALQCSICATGEIPLFFDHFSLPSDGLSLFSDKKQVILHVSLGLEFIGFLFFRGSFRTNIPSLLLSHIRTFHSNISIRSLFLSCVHSFLENFQILVGILRAFKG